MARREPNRALLEREIPTVPRGSLPVPSLNDGILRQLSISAKHLAKPEVWAEADILERLYYKNKNQHRRTKYFGRFQGVRRILARLRAVPLAQLLEKLAAAMRPEGEAKRNSWVWSKAPYQDYVVELVLVVHRTCELLRELRRACAQCYAAFRQLASATLFMPFALAIMASCARIALLSRPWLADAGACLDALKNWAQTLPLSSPSARGMDGIHVLLGFAPFGQKPETTGSDDEADDRHDSPSAGPAVEATFTEAMALSESFFASIETRDEDAGCGKAEGEDSDVAPPKQPADRGKKKQKRKLAAKNEIDDIFG
ncbi:hypothetical protein DFJ74DRAFT_243738 [Hyaloraphidium curvatum]|nr:hypothetical protein DFJ74DRAFT_243738 [Hyaloraphidium curvatum]